MHWRLAARARYEVGTFRLWRRTIRELRHAAKSVTEPEEAVEYAFADHGPFSLMPIQIRSEIVGFLKLVKADQPRRALEIGAQYGATAFLLAWASAPRARLVSLEIMQWPFSRRYISRRFARSGQRVEVWHADSQLDETRDAVSRFFGDDPLDLLFIDGDHSYNGVRRDYELYSPFVRVGGLIAFHDIVDGPQVSVGEVPRFWREIAPSLDETQELVESWSQGGYGIGVGRRRA